MNFPSLFTMSIYLKKCIVPQSAVMTQSDWPVATVNRSADIAAHVNVSCNTFIGSQTWMTWKFWHWYGDKKSYDDHYRWFSTRPHLKKRPKVIQKWPIDIMVDWVLNLWLKFFGQPSLTSHTRSVVHDVPVGVIPERDWEDYKEPAMPEFDVSAVSILTSLPFLRLFVVGYLLG